MSIGDAEFIRLLKKDVDYLRRALERFENLIPSVCAPVQDQWRLQAQSRKDFALELEILLNQAEQCIDPSLQRAESQSRRTPASCSLISLPSVAHDAGQSSASESGRIVVLHEPLAGFRSHLVFDP